LSHLQTHYKINKSHESLETSNYQFADPVCLFDLQVSRQFISEEDNETESENEIVCTKPKRLRKSNKRKSDEYY
jgi:hypothetical protein